MPPASPSSDPIADPPKFSILRNPAAGFEKYRHSQVPRYEWIITGTLVARTIPSTSPPNSMTVTTPTEGSSLTGTSTTDCHARSLRGIMRRDLNQASGGQGCRGGAWSPSALRLPGLPHIERTYLSGSTQ